MSLKFCNSVATVAAVTGLVGSTASASITIPTVPIGNPGNGADPTTGYGSVSYTYNIGQTEVTNAQYAAFLNAVAATDTNALYNTNMAGSFVGITRSGSSGSYTYSTVSGRANNPVGWLSLWDAMRFTNWLHNGQPTGGQNSSTTEDGAYTLTATGISTNTVSRNADWQWAVTSDDEWYKAAYHQPSSLGGDSDSYWQYPTSSNSITTAQANFGVLGNTTAAGTYAANYYGTFDMGGNVWERSDTIISSFPGAPSRSQWGGSWANNANAVALSSGFTWAIDPSGESSINGFRVVQVPGPLSVAPPMLGALVAARGRRRA